MRIAGRRDFALLPHEAMHNHNVADLGRRVYGLGAIVLGSAGLVFGEFATVWEPVQPGVPHTTALAYIAALLLVIGGACVWSRHLGRIGAVSLGIVYCSFALLWLPRVIGFPQLYGTWGGFFEELAPATAALIEYASSTRRNDANAARVGEAGRYLFGICALSFGLEHFTAVPQTGEMVPAWLPAHRFWAIATGVFHFLAGVAVLTGVYATLAARLLTAMLVGFGLLVWLPRLIANPHVHTVWAGNAVNLTIAGAAWVVADWLARRDRYEGALSPE